VTASNGTIQPNSAVVNNTTKTISVNVTGSTGDTEFLYAVLPQSVISVTNLSDWNITVNGVKTSADISENTTHTFMYMKFVFGNQVTVAIQGNLIPELSNMLLVPLIAPSATVAMIKIRTKKKI